jgi:hypothetical protein
MSNDVSTYLWLTRHPPYPPLRGGDVDYTRNLMHAVAEFASIKALGQETSTPPPAVPGLDWTLTPHKTRGRAASIVSPLPSVAHRHVSRAYLDAALQAAQGVDAVLIDFISQFWIAAPLMKILKRRKSPPRVLIVNHNFEHDVRRQMVEAESAPVMKAALAYDAWKAGRLERQANQLADALVANTEADARRFAQITPKPAVVITPGYSGPRAAPRVINAATPPRLCILGHHEAHHKRMVLERTLAALSAQGVEQRYVIDVVGAGDHASLQARFPGFNYRGFVEDIAGYLTTVRLGLIPDEIGGGFKHRVLSHVFQRIPMLAVRPAVYGMGLEADVHFAAADDLAHMAAMIPALMEDFPRLNALQDAAYRHCEAAYDWRERGLKLHGFIQDLSISRSQAGA